jgi:hypothetical protein
MLEPLAGDPRGYIARSLVGATKDAVLLGMMATAGAMIVAQARAGWNAATWRLAVGFAGAAAGAAMIELHAWRWAAGVLSGGAADTLPVRMLILKAVFVALASAGYALVARAALRAMVRA